MIPNHPYYQFEESNVFMYVENDDEVYLIYNEGEGEEEEEETSEQDNSQSQSLTSSEHSH